MTILTRGKAEHNLFMEIFIVEFLIYKVDDNNNPLFHAEKIAIETALTKTNKRYLQTLS